MIRASYYERQGFETMVNFEFPRANGRVWNGTLFQMIGGCDGIGEGLG